MPNERTRRPVVFSGLADAIITDPIQVANAAWSDAMRALQRATSDLLRGDRSAGARGQQAIVAGSYAAASVGQLTDGHPNGALQQEWVGSLEAFNAAWTDYDPDAPPTSIEQPDLYQSGFTEQGIRLGRMFVPWTTVALVVAAFVVVPIMLKRRRDV